MDKIKFSNTFEYKLIYIFRINDSFHKGALKIGDATIHTNLDYEELKENCHELNEAAKKRIDSYTSTAGIIYELLHTEIAVYKVNNADSKKYGKIVAFRDYNVHDVLKRTGIKSKYFDTNKKQNEWFITDLETAKKAIKCVKEEKTALDNKDITYERNPIIFRPEQKDAIKKTISQYKVSDRMLWNAKMRFGKTLSALQVVKEMKFEKTIIITHRPVVSNGWFEDFEKIFYDEKEYEFGSKTQGKSIDELIRNKSKFVYFASIQDLRGSDIVGGNFDKNDEIFEIDWDFIVVDEAHEGTQTKLGKSVLEELIKSKTNIHPKILELSGTPFNILTDFNEDSIYTWDYIMEQEAKKDWELNHFGDSNPYEELPTMNIFTYHLEKYLTGFMDIEDKAFNFKEFFRTWTGDIKKDLKEKPDESQIGDFVYEKDINSFLNLITKKDDRTSYPFSTEEYRNYFKHTLWVMPGVKEAKAMSKLLKKHSIFSQFEIVNVAGDGDEEVDSRDALKAVKEAMTDNPEETYTITLSCGRLTTGVSVPEWTAVLMLSGSYSTAASQYLQTIFRVQTPANINGKIKENCYVFDFAPDRTLKMIAESVQLSARSSNNPTSELQLQKFLNFCPVIAIDNTGMKEYKVNYLLQELKKAYAERVVKNGFDDSKLYNDELLKLDGIELKEFEELKKIIGSSKPTNNVKEIEINSEGFTQEEYEVMEKAKKKKERELTEEEKELLKQLKEKRDNKQKAISILRGISIRIPLLVYGVDKDIDIDITVDNFTDLIDDLSWEEFMPNKVDKNMFKKFAKYYDKDIFIASSRRIRYISKTADELEPTERVKRIARLFATFKNPDKETVLTPWKVVNMHLSRCIGGYNFFDDKYEIELDKPRFVDQGKVTHKTICEGDSKILEINSKSGLYPLYMSYSIYKEKVKNKEDELSFKDKQKMWDDVVTNDIFVVCKTPMAKYITKRTLVGYRNVKVNTRYFEDLINQLKQTQKSKTFISKMKQGKSYWKVKDDDNMKFNAIIGNPPYQIMDGGAQASSMPVYQYFVEVSKEINPDYISMIIPSRWMTGGKGLEAFRKEMINDKHISKLFDHFNGKDCFSNVDIKGGVCYFLWDKENEKKCNITTYTGNEVLNSERYLSDENDEIYIRDYRLIDIKNKISSFQEESFENIVSARKPYGLGGDVFKDPSKYDLPEFSDKFIEKGITVIGLDEKQKRVKKYVNRDYPFPKKDMLDDYKIFITRNYGNGKMGEIPSEPIIATPQMACTETFIQIGAFKTEQEAKNCFSYMKTKLFRLLVGIRKQDQGASRSIYKLVPMQDFSESWNDDKLYRKYKLSEEEIRYINENIEEWV